MALAFSSKAATLVALRSVLKSARIAPLVVFTIDDWQADKKACSNQVVDSLGSGPWIVRSSCSLEDTKELSNAGRFLSIPNVSLKQLQRSIERVIKSYGKASQKDAHLFVSVRPSIA